MDFRGTVKQNHIEVKEFEAADTGYTLVVYQGLN